MGKSRSIWTGTISFGLVNIPIRLYTATTSHDIQFHQFEEKTGQRIHYKRVTERGGREVPYEKIVKGYEVRKGKIVLIEPDELRAIEPRKTRTLEIEEFVDLHDIDPLVWDATYYIGPDERAGAQKAYELLRRAMEEMGKVGVGRFVMRTKEYLATVRPLGPGLALETMYYADEVRDFAEVADLPRKQAVAPRELALARQLIESLTGTWDHRRFADTYRDRVMELIERKARGEEIAVEEAAEQPAEVVDLMEAQKANLVGGAGGRTTGAPRGRGRKVAPSARTRTSRASGRKSRPSTKKKADKAEKKAA